MSENFVDGALTGTADRWDKQVKALESERDRLKTDSMNLVYAKEEIDRLRSELATYQQMSGRAELLEEIDRLKAELEYALGASKAMLMTADLQKKDRDLWKSHAEKMAEALRKYGDHKTRCRAWIGSDRPKGDCDCGYQEALAEFHSSETHSGFEKKEDNKNHSQFADDGWAH